MNAIDLPLDLIREHKRIDAFAQGNQLVKPDADSLVTLSQQTIQGSGWSVVHAANAGADPLLAEQLYRGLKEIHHPAPLVAIEIVEKIDGHSRIDAFPSHQTSNMRPVL